MGVLAWIGNLLLRAMPRSTARDGWDNPIRKRHEAMAEAARRKADRQGLIVDPYPDDRKEPRVTIWLRGKVGSKSIIELVDLDGYSFREINLRKEWRRNWLIDRLIEAHLRIVPRLDVLEEERIVRREQRRQREQGQ